MRAVVAYLVCALVWGTTWFAIRVCIGEGGYPTIPAAALRFSLAALVMLPIWYFGLARPGPANRAQWLWLVAAGLLNAAGYSLVYVGEQSVPGGLAAVLFGTQPLIIAILVTATRTERVTRAELVGALIAVVGIGVIYWDRTAVSSEQGLGIALILIAVVVSGIYSWIVKREAAGINPLASAAIFIWVTAVALWAFLLVRGVEPIPWPPPTAPTVALGYLAVFGSVIAFATFFYLLKRVSLMTSATLVLIIPIIALAVDAVWEDNVRLVGRTYAGVAVTLLGVLISFTLRQRPDVSP